MVQPIFRDETGRRWLRIKIYFFVSLFLLWIILLTYFLSLYLHTELLLIKKAALFILSSLNYLLRIYLFLAITIGILRLATMFFFSYRQWRRQKSKREKKKRKLVKLETQAQQTHSEQSMVALREQHAVESKRKVKRTKRKHKPKVSVLIPVYNEEIVITKTIEALLKSKYPLEEILVIDDGSTDRTAVTVKKAFSSISKVKLISKKNGGKASALNLGFQRAVGEIVVTIDADTIFTKKTISYLVKPFKNPLIAAVSGNCKIGNIHNQITLWQHIEYVTAFNLEKRAFRELNCITVVPGSNSAWRKSAVRKMGYYDHDTLAEDTDLTLKLLHAGHQIAFDDRALSYEECPETVKDFLKQRFRWSYGILQSAWKHRMNILHSTNKNLKYFAVPSLLFSYLLYLTSPLIDVLFIIALFFGVKIIFLFVLFFYFSDFLASAYAFILEKEKLRPLIWVFIQRMGYRYFIAYVTWKTLLTALKGDSVGWNKFKRSGKNFFHL